MQSLYRTARSVLFADTALVRVETPQYDALGSVHTSRHVEEDVEAAAVVKSLTILSQRPLCTTKRKSWQIKDAVSGISL